MSERVNGPVSFRLCECSTREFNQWASHSQLTFLLYTPQDLLLGYVLIQHEIIQNRLFKPNRYGRPNSTVPNYMNNFSFTPGLLKYRVWMRFFIEWKKNGVMMNFRTNLATCSENYSNEWDTDVKHSAGQWSWWKLKVYRTNFTSKILFKNTGVLVFLQTHFSGLTTLQ